MRLLYVDDMIPAPRLGWGFPRSYQVVKALAARCAVTIYPTINTLQPEPETTHLRSLGVEFALTADRNAFDSFFMENYSKFDAVWISRPRNLKYCAFSVKKQLIPFVYDAECLSSIRDHLQASLKNTLEQYPPLDDAIAQEVSSFREAALVIAVSDIERKAIRLRSEQEVITVPYFSDVHSPQADFSARSNLLFTGSFLASPSPNEDAIQFFSSQCLRRLHGLFGLRLTIAGYRCERLLDGAMAEDDLPVDLAGNPLDLSDLYSMHRVFVIPTRYCAGIPLKMIDAMAAGVPVVVSTPIASQMNLDGRHFRIAQTSEDFVEHVAKLYSDQEEWALAREAGFEYVRSHFGSERFEASIDSAVHHLRSVIK